MSNRKSKHNMLVFVIPAFVLYTAFVIFPAVSSIYLSLTSWNGISDTTMKFVGLDNYIAIFNDARFYGALKNTILVAVVFTVMANVVAFLIALTVNSVAIGKTAFRSVFYIPVLISGIISGFIWTIMFNYSFGIINSVLGHLGVEKIDWLGRSPNAIISIMIVLVWQMSGYYMIIYLAGLQGIPSELMEAATIDGASTWQRFKNVTLPLMSGTFTVNFTLALISGFKVFDQISIMTNGGPGFDTETLTYLIYKVAFGEQQRQGYGTALAMMLFLLILIIGIMQIKFLRKREIQL